jgi:hypothetical protein
MKIKPGPSQSRLVELFAYDSERGGLRRRSVARGAVRRDVCKRRTRTMRVDWVLYEEHRLVWLYHTGEWPDNPIDHINGNPKDNRIENLRSVSHVVNMQNQRRAMSTSKTGLLGAFPWKGKFLAQITVDGRIRNLGVFKTAQEAHEAYVKAKREFHDGCTI